MSPIEQQAATEYSDFRYGYAGLGEQKIDGSSVRNLETVRLSYTRCSLSRKPESRGQLLHRTRQQSANCGPS